MIKFIILITRIVITAAIALVFASCNFHSIKGSGNVTTETRSIGGDFKSIDANRGLEVELIQSAERGVTVIADDNLHGHIKTKVENGVLVITSDISNFRGAASKKVVVRMPVIENIQVSGGVTFEGKNTIRGKEIRVQSSSGSEINIDLEYDSADLQASSGSNITVKGKALKLETESSSGSDIDAQDLLANDIKARASSGSSIDVHPLASLDAKASSGASVDYSGHPGVLHKKASSGGSVDFK